MSRLWRGAHHQKTCSLQSSSRCSSSFRIARASSSEQEPLLSPKSPASWKREAACAWSPRKPHRKCAPGRKQKVSNGIRVLFSPTISKECCWLSQLHHPRDCTSASSRRRRGAACSATSWTFPLSAISTTPPWSSAELCRSPFRLPGKAQPLPSASEKSSRISLAQNTKNGSRSSVKRATDCSPLSWIRKNGSASCTRTPVTKPSKRSSRAGGNRNAQAEFSGFLPNPTYFSFSIKNIDSMDSFFRALLH